VRTTADIDIPSVCVWPLVADSVEKVILPEGAKILNAAGAVFV
jgi:hypothetical protein